jgi:hypothetical protein
VVTVRALSTGRRAARRGAPREVRRPAGEVRRDRQGFRFSWNFSS